MTPSDEELSVLQNQEFLKLKNSVSEKVIAYLAEIERELHREINLSSFPFPEQTFLKAGKISRGEQYRLLPYFILDYPRLFSKEEVFAFRTMLWWGNHFSCTLHLAGPVLNSFRKSIISNLQKEKDLYFCVNAEPWDYHYGEENYVQIKHLDQKKIVDQIEKNGFVKISAYISISEWHDFKRFTLTSFARFLQCLD